jgi:alpha-tubulin suppressor-like RCC1 family protein
VGVTHTCALRPDSTIVCFGSNTFGESNPPGGLFQALSARGQQACGQRFDGSVECWGRSTDLQDWTPPPPGSFLSVQCRSVAACAMQADHTLTCWGNGSPESQPPAGSFLSYAIGEFHGCAIRPDRSIACWGRNTFGQSNPP